MRAARPHVQLRAFVEPCGRAGCPPACATQSLCGALWPCGLPARMGDSEPLWSLVAVRAARPHGHSEPLWSSGALCDSEPLRSLVAARAARPHGRLRAFVEPCGRAGCPPAWVTQSLCGALGCPPAWATQSLCGALWPCGRAGCPPAWATQSVCGALWPCGGPARMGDSEPLWSLVAVWAARPHGRLRAFVEPCGRAGCPPAWATQSLCRALWPCGLPARMRDSEPLWSLVAVRAARPHGRLRAFMEPCGRAGCPPAWATQSLCGALWPCGLGAQSLCGALWP